MNKIDHIGIAVESIAASRAFYEALGLRVTHEEVIEHEQVRTAMIPIGDSRIELLEPLREQSDANSDANSAPNSPIARFLKKRGPGLHHIALHVDDIAASLASLKAAGARLISDQVQVGAGGHLYFFVHPSSAGGVLLEICQDVAPASTPEPHQ